MFVGQFASGVGVHEAAAAEIRFRHPLSQGIEDRIDRFELLVRVGCSSDSTGEESDEVVNAVSGLNLEPKEPVVAWSPIISVKHPICPGSERGC